MPVQRRRGGRPPRPSHRPEALRLCGARRSLATSAPDLTEKQEPNRRQRRLQGEQTPDEAGARAARWDDLRARGLLRDGDAPPGTPQDIPQPGAPLPPGEWHERFAALVPPGPPLTDEEWRRSAAMAEALWPPTDGSDPAQWDARWEHRALEGDKRQLLRDLGVTPIVWVLPRRPGHGQPLARNLRLLGGPVCLLLDAPRLGMGEERSYFIMEHADHQSAYRRWAYANSRKASQKSPTDSRPVETDRNTG